MERYRTMNDGYVQRQSDLALIPPTTANADWNAYLVDVSNGAEVLPFDYVAEAQRQADAKAVIDEAAVKKAKDDELREIDIRSIRSLRAIASGTGTAEDIAKLAELEAEAVSVRTAVVEEEII